MLLFLKALVAFGRTFSLQSYLRSLEFFRRYAVPLARGFLIIFMPLTTSSDSGPATLLRTLAPPGLSGPCLLRPLILLLAIPPSAISRLIPGYPGITQTVTYPRISQYKSGWKSCFGISKDKILVMGYPGISLSGISRDK